MKKDKTQKNVKNPAVQKYERIFREVDIQHNKENEPNYFNNEESNWIISDNNSTFKSIVNYG